MFLIIIRYIHEYRYLSTAPDHWKIAPLVDAEHPLPAPVEESTFATLFPKCVLREARIRIRMH
jgi:hypothetical protein